jgi:hypothetical protein
MMGLFVSVSSFAQSHSDRISVGAGALYQRGLDATISWEHETRYHNAWEYFINGYIKWDECASCGHVCCAMDGREANAHTTNAQIFLIVFIIIYVFIIFLSGLNVN